MMSDDLPAARLAVHVVADEDAGERADVVLGRRVSGLSRRVARSLARDGKLRLDGRRAPPSTRVRAGQRLELELELDGDAAPLPVDVVATTPRFVYVRKPAGVHTVALTPAQPGVLATAVAARFPECASASQDPREGGAVHRLDRPTSGVVAFARTREIWTRARAGFRDARVAKHYLAVVSPSVPELSWPPSLPAGGLRGWIEAHPGLETDDEITRRVLAPLVDGAAEPLALEPVRVRAPLGRDGSTRSAVRLDGRRASTVIQPLARAAGRWLVRLLLETGSRHQARVHLAWIGLPIVADTCYGPRPADGSESLPTAIHLHAFALDLGAVFPEETPVFVDPAPGFWLLS